MTAFSAASPAASAAFSTASPALSSGVAGRVERVAGGIEPALVVVDLGLVDGGFGVGVDRLLAASVFCLAGGETERGNGDESESNLLHVCFLQ